MAQIDITRTELVWPGKYKEDGTLKEPPRLSLPFQVSETVNESRSTREAKKRGQQLSAAYLDSLTSGDQSGRSPGQTSQEHSHPMGRIWLIGLGERLGETEGRVLLLIRVDSRISTRALAAEIGVSTTAMDKTLAKLKNRGILRWVGPARGGRWQILEDTDE